MQTGSQGQSMGLPVASAYPLMSNTERRRQTAYAYIIQFTTATLHKHTYDKDIIFGTT